MRRKQQVREPKSYLKKTAAATLIFLLFLSGLLALAPFGRHSAFAVDQYTVTASVSGGHGQVSPASQPVDSNASCTVNIIPDTGYYIASISDNNVTVPGPYSNSYRLNNVNAAHTIVVTFAKTQYYFYFADGNTGEGFHEYLCIGNSNPNPATIRVAYGGDGGFPSDAAAIPYDIPASSRLTIDVNVASPVQGEVCLKVITDSTGICAERPMYFGLGSITGGTDTVGATAPSKTWYFAEGCTRPGFGETICMVNCSSQESDMQLRFQTEEAGEVVKDLTLAAGQRVVISVNGLLGNNYQTSLKIESEQPIIAERTMYFTYLGMNNWGWTGGTSVMGATQLSNQYYFAEGTTRVGFEEWLTIQNPSASAITVHAAYQFGAGQGDPIVRDYTIPSGSRITLFMPSEVGSEKDVSVKLSSAAQFLAERPIYFNYTYGGVAWNGGHCVIGAQAPASEWFFAEGATIPNFQEWLCIQNPSAEAASVEISYYVQGQGSLPVRTETIPANSRQTFWVNQHAGDNLQLSVRVKVVSGPSVICERPMYFSYLGWNGGHDVVGFTP